MYRNIRQEVELVPNYTLYVKENYYNINLLHSKILDLRETDIPRGANFVHCIKVHKLFTDLVEVWRCVRPRQSVHGESQSVHGAKLRTILVEKTG
jgi:hypothetical protein